MATESDLRDLLRGPEPEGRAAIDLDAVITRARRRRRPKAIAAQALGSVAAVGAVLTGVALAIPPAPESSMLVAEDSAGGSAEEFASSPESLESADVGREGVLDACGEPASAWPLLGWELDVADPGPTPADAPVVRVSLRNDGPVPAAGEIEVTSVTFLRDGVVVAHGSSPGVATAVLEPDELFTWDVPVTATPCDPAAPLAPGSYEVRPVIEYRHSSGAGGTAVEPIVGTPGPLELR